eukprot:PLAT7606.3.p2 GENE.PLAT7606.3~~PLAT7606.3.p2  ORF type:complete len:270 (+),score=147.85 PLAT7606.3:77-811(+)
MFGNPEDIFAAFFGTRSPFEAEGRGGMGDGMGGMPFMFGGGGGGSGSSFDAGRSMARPRKKRKAVETEFSCSLEELYAGCTKRMRVTRRVAQPDGRLAEESKVLELPVRAGFKEGTRITFDGAGDQLSGEAAGDVVFVLKQRAHDRFTREGNDLAVTVRISLAEALTGTVVSVRTLDDRTLRVRVPALQTTSYVKVVEGEGMPIRRGGRGDLHIKFALRLPRLADMPSDKARMLEEALDMRKWD